LPRAMAQSAAPALATTTSGAPLRMAFVYVPNGAIMDSWSPKGTGSAYELNDTMKPIADFKEDFQVISGCAHKHGWANGDGGGDHARSNTVLTGAHAKKTAGSDIQLGISVDQVAANHTGQATRFHSLELSCDEHKFSGKCDSGYSCAYQHNLSWRSSTTPAPAEQNPRLAFERLFGSGPPQERVRNYQLRQQQRKSILDFVMGESKTMKRRLARSDQDKLDEYLTGLRDIERRIETAEQFGPLHNPDVQTPAGIPKKYEDHIRLMFDILLLAFQTDSTRIGTFLMAHDGSNRTFNELGIPQGHHGLTHHRLNKDKMAKLRKIDLFYMEQYAYFLDRLKHTEDMDGKSLLHNSMIVYCSGLSDANRHNHDDLPVILAGHGGGVLNPGRHIKLDHKTPMSNLYVSMLNKMGAKVDSFGDSTGMLTGI